MDKDSSVIFPLKRAIARILSDITEQDSIIVMTCLDIHERSRPADFLNRAENLVTSAKDEYGKVTLLELVRLFGKHTDIPDFPSNEVMNTFFEPAELTPS